MLKVTNGEQTYLFSFRYTKKPFEHATGNSEVTTCFIRTPGKEGITLGQATISRNYRDKLWPIDMVRKTALTLALLDAKFDRDTRKRFWETYHTRKVEAPV